MFETLEIRKVANGFVVVLTTEDDVQEFVYDTSRKTMKFIRQFVDAKQMDQ